MTLKVNTPAGLRDVKDLKVKTAEGALADVERLVVKTNDGTFEMVWGREPPEPPPPPPPPEPPEIPQGVEPLTLTVNTAIDDPLDSEFILPIYSNPNWIVDWGDSVVARVRNLSEATHAYETPGTYQIKIYPATAEAAQTATATAWLLPFGFSLYDNYEKVPETGRNSMAHRQKVLHVAGTLVPEMFGTASQIAEGKVGNSVCDHWFFGCTNLTMSDTFTFAGWENITEVGGAFCYSMFARCSSDNFTMGTAFNLPQNIQIIGSSGARYAAINNNLRQKPSYGFCCEMFYGCNGSSFNMNSIFTLPQTLEMFGAWFCFAMFRDCSGNAFAMNQVFNLPQNVMHIQPANPSDMMGHVFEQTFYNCRGNAFTMNDIFQTPQNLEHGWVQTFSRMFYQCRGAAFKMNDIFTLPQNMQKSYSGLAQYMFYRCDGALFTMNQVFQAPPNIVHSYGHGRNHLRSTFNLCNGLAFQVNNVFEFPELSVSHLNTTVDSKGEINVGAYYQTFAGITRPQNRTAASIIGTNPVPLAPREAFGTGFPDWSSIDANWRG